MRRRFGFFVLLGPLLSWLVFVAMVLPELLGRPPFENGVSFFAAALVICYVFGAVPLFALAGIDHLLVRYPWRLGVGALIGFAMSYAMFRYAAQGGAEKHFQEYWIGLGLMGAIPAVVASWLSGRKPPAAMRLA